MALRVSTVPMAVPRPVLLLIFAWLAACGDDADTGGNPDAAADAGSGADVTPDDATDDVDDAGAPDGDADGSDADDNDAGGPDGQTDGQTDGGDPADAPDGGDPAWPVADCDPLDPALCSLPWPSNLYLQPDAARPTGYTLRFGATTLPANRRGIHVSPEPFARLDGYGLGTPIMAMFADLSLDGLAGEETIERSLGPDSPTALFAVTDAGLLPVPHWVELDATVAPPEPQVLFLRPAVILQPATRYIVAFQGLATTDGDLVPASEAFAALRDGLPTDDVAIESRREAFESMFDELEAAGMDRQELTLAWDFVTASEETLHAPIETATALALDAIGPEGAPLRFDSVDVRRRPETEGSGETDSQIAMFIEATMTTPTVVQDLTGSGADLLLDADGLPVLQGEEDVFVRIIVPHRAVEGEEVGVIVYGHGLLGDAYEIDLGHIQQVAESLGYVIVAVAMRGMSEPDASGVLATTFDLSNFSVIADGLVQGVTQTHVLARTAITRLPGLLAELDADITIDPDRLHWFGGSQGGIFGTTILASSPDIERGVLAVPGQNYATMLQRSVNFEVYFDTLRNNYAPGATTAVLIALAQLRWDFTDPVSWWGRLVERSLDTTNPSAALLLISKGDKQVAVVTNEIVARTFPELAVMAPYDREREPFAVAQTAYPHQGSGMILFDFGNAWPGGTGNLPPSDPLPDPHPRIAEVTEAEELLRRFLDDGIIVDVCGGDGCTPR